MAIEPSTKDFLGFLHTHPEVRMLIRASPDKTLLYAGSFWSHMRPVWRDLLAMKASNPQLADKEILSEVLARIVPSGQPFNSLLDWAKHVDALSPIAPYKENGWLVWRALSGIFAANAVGKVSFYIGSGVTRDEKVFAATELAVLARNPNVDAVTKDMLAYYQRCVTSKMGNINTGFIAG